ncbi:MAG: aspartate ammonia-lyase [Kiritimatiellia bacterium]
MRTEKDSMGERQVPDKAYYGIHTVRSLENFNISGEPVPLELIYGMVHLKRACAKANAGLGLLPKDKADAISKACDRVLAGEFDGEFRIDVYQAGSGTSSHMNVCEVLANIACVELGGKKGDRKLVHPNDHVNMGQSTNNVFPSAIRIASADLSMDLQEALKHLAEKLAGKEQEFKKIIKSGRTHLQDAVPVTLGQEFGAWKRAVQKASARIGRARDALLELGVGGNAVGTGLNTPKKFRAAILKELKGDCRLPEDGVEITQFMTDLGEMSSAVKLAALDLHKIANDLRLLGSGPNTGLGEIVLPPVEPGSSIMPGKINPGICEAVNMACMQVVGLDAAVCMACGAGQLELNTHMPLIGANLVKMLHLLANASMALADKCVAGIAANEKVCRRNFENSASLATVLNPKLGYDKVAELVKESAASGRNLKDLVLARGLLDEAGWNELMKNCTGPLP